MKRIISNSESKYLYIEEILKTIPHRFPFLLLDYIIDFEYGKSLKAVKNISFNESYFQGHFPNLPIFPGVLIIEAIAQAISFLIIKSKKKETFNSKKKIYLAAIKSAKFKSFVRPGDQMILDVKFLKKSFNFYLFEGNAKVKKKIVCKTSIICAKKI